MIKEGLLDKILYQAKRLVPKPIFNFFQPAYHTALAYAGAFIYKFPSRKLKVIGVTGTKGKSTVVYLIAKLLENSGRSVAACGSLGFKIKEREWPNTLKMTMPGRFRLQRLMAEAVKAGCEYFILEVTSEGIKQKRHLGITFDCAVFTNLHKEHIESHGSFENYYRAKQELFKLTKNIHVINADDKYVRLFGDFEAKRKIFYGFTKGDLVASNIKLSDYGSSFEVYGTVYNTFLTGQFNVMNLLAVLAVGAVYRVDLPSAKPILESVRFIPGRMEFLQREPFKVVVDYAHTPDSLEAVYKTLKGPLPLASSTMGTMSSHGAHGRLICVLGAAGGGRDKWKRPEFGKIAAQYCDEIILTNEDPYDEIPEKIIEEIFSGISSSLKLESLQVHTVIDRQEAIKKALTLAQKGDTIVITGKGSETSMAISGNKKIPWSDREVIRDLLK